MAESLKAFGFGMAFAIAAMLLLNKLEASRTSIDITQVAERGSVFAIDGRPWFCREIREYVEKKGEKKEK